MVGNCDGKKRGLRGRLTHDVCGQWLSCLCAAPEGSWWPGSLCMSSAHACQRGQHAQHVHRCLSWPVPPLSKCQQARAVLKPSPSACMRCRTCLQACRPAIMGCACGVTRGSTAHLDGKVHAPVQILVVPELRIRGCAAVCPRQAAVHVAAALAGVALVCALCLDQRSAVGHLGGLVRDPRASLSGQWYGDDWVIRINCVGSQTQSGICADLGGLVQGCSLCATADRHR